MQSKSGGHFGWWDARCILAALQEHWLTVRKIANDWYNFNSLYPAPEYLGTLYLTAFLATLREAGYSIFVIKGLLPQGHLDDAAAQAGSWFTPEEVTASSRPI